MTTQTTHSRGRATTRFPAIAAAAALSAFLCAFPARAQTDPQCVSANSSNIPKDPEFVLRMFRLKAVDYRDLVKSLIPKNDKRYIQAVKLYIDARAKTNAMIDVVADDIRLNVASDRLKQNAPAAIQAMAAFVCYANKNTNSKGLLDLIGPIKDLVAAVVKAGLDIEQRYHDRTQAVREFKAKSLRDGGELPPWDAG
jgi:hypothetical protein